MARIKHSKPAKDADPTKPHLASVKRNVARMQPGLVETDETTGQRVIHPVANPQQVNPISDATHEKAAVAEAEVLLDKKATAREKRAATEKSNEVQRTAADRVAAAKAKNPRARARTARAPRKSKSKNPAPPATPPPGPAPSAPAATA